jgi:hypothetical protein
VGRLELGHVRWRGERGRIFLHSSDRDRGSEGVGGPEWMPNLEHRPGGSAADHALAIVVRFACDATDVECFCRSVLPHSIERLMRIDGKLEMALAFLEVLSDAHVTRLRPHTAALIRIVEGLIAPEWSPARWWPDAALVPDVNPSHYAEHEFKRNFWAPLTSTLISLMRAAHVALRRVDAAAAERLTVPLHFQMIFWSPIHSVGGNHNFRGRRGSTTSAQVVEEVLGCFRSLPAAQLEPIASKIVNSFIFCSSPVGSHSDWWPVGHGQAISLAMMVVRLASDDVQAALLPLLIKMLNVGWPPDQDHVHGWPLVTLDHLTYPSSWRRGELAV